MDSTVADSWPNKRTYNLINPFLGVSKMPFSSTVSDVSQPLKKKLEWKPSDFIDRFRSSELKLEFKPQVIELIYPSYALPMDLLSVTLHKTFYNPLLDQDILLLPSHCDYSALSSAMIASIVQEPEIEISHVTNYVFNPSNSETEVTTAEIKINKKPAWIFVPIQRHAQAHYTLLLLDVREWRVDTNFEHVKAYYIDPLECTLDWYNKNQEDPYTFYFSTLNAELNLKPENIKYISLGQNDNMMQAQTGPTPMVCSDYVIGVIASFVLKEVSLDTDDLEALFSGWTLQDEYFKAIRFVQVTYFGLSYLWEQLPDSVKTQLENFPMALRRLSGYLQTALESKSIQDSQIPEPFLIGIRKNKEQIEKIKQNMHTLFSQNIQREDIKTFMPTPSDSLRDRKRLASQTIFFAEIGDLKQHQTLPAEEKAQNQDENKEQHLVEEESTISLPMNFDIQTRPPTEDKEDTTTLPFYMR